MDTNIIESLSIQRLKIIELENKLGQLELRVDELENRYFVDRKEVWEAIGMKQ